MSFRDTHASILTIIEGEVHDSSTSLPSHVNTDTEGQSSLLTTERTRIQTVGEVFLAGLLRSEASDPLCCYDDRKVSKIKVKY